MRSIPTAGVLAAQTVFLLTACAVDSSAGQQNFSASPDGSTEASDATASGGEASDSTSSGALLDIPEGEGAGTLTDGSSDSCGKVDFLFVIDVSSSMETHQQNLINSYDGFIEGITNHFGPNSDFHIGVISTDEYMYNAPGCTTELGSLVTQVPNDDYTATIDCAPYVEGHRFMTEADDLGVKFPCTADVSPEGSDIEKPIRGAINALTPEMNAPGACNEGFSRQDALLVIVMISDNHILSQADTDANPFTETSSWYPDMVALKGGHPENIVVIGFVAAGDTWCIPFGYDGEQAPNHINFIEAFGDNGIVHNVCDEDYGPDFITDVDQVLEACEKFVPPG